MDFKSTLHDHDVVLTDYERLRAHSALFSGVHWHRIVLDECQEIKFANTKVRQLLPCDIGHCCLVYPLA